MSHINMTPDPICPKCGHVDRDAHELGFNSADICETECPACGVDLTVIRYVEVVYSTSTKKEEP